MNTTQLKSFAAEARKSLLSGVKSKMNALGFKDNGFVDERDYPIQAHDGTLFQNEIYDVAFYGKWMRLRDEIARYGFRQVCEEGAYTWFNRLVAIQILSRNGLIDPVLEFESPDVRIPLLVKQAQEDIRPEMPAFDAMRLNTVIDDDNRITEQFAILIVAYCRATPILYKCFGTLNDFTELLLPTNILAANGFLNLLNGSSFITEDDYKTTELIGWLYQFYISERKDEVFASFKSGHKAEAEDIPAATQIFTPNWIVKYMVQNTLGRIYLDNNPDSTLKDQWQYLVDVPLSEGVAEGRGSQSRVPRLEISNPEDLTFADLSCGSGHILGEAFDMLFEIYKEEGFTRRQAIENIFRHNIIGIDIDTRAKQLATFALMLKACQYWPDAIQCSVMPQVFDMPLPDDPICERYPILKQANNLGSIMKIEPLEGETHPFVKALTDKYAAVVMNPPYMNSNNMNDSLSLYVQNTYEEGKADLMTVFMLVAENHTIANGLWSMINLPSWMFLPSFKSIRIHEIDNQHIHSLIYMGRGVFGSDFGSVAFTIKNTVANNSNTTCRKLFETQGLVRTNDEIKDNFFDKSYGYFIVNQKDFHKIPGCPLAFWLPSIVLDAFENRISSYGVAKKGLSTGDNNKYMRLWFEVSHSKSIYDANTFDNEFKWYPINKGGAYRKWYGNNEYVINWYHNGEEIRAFSGSVIRNPQYYLKPCITWTMLSASCFGVRYSNNGKLFEGAGPSLFVEKENINYILGFLCTNMADMVLRSLNPTINININDVLNLPIIDSAINHEVINDLVQDNIAISKQDWDAHETSWDFKENELVRVFKAGKATDLESSVNAFKEEWEQKFHQLHENEEDLNRQFIEIYGLQDELSPDVPLEEVTILQQGEISIEDK